MSFWCHDSQNNILRKDGNTYSYDYSSSLSPHAVRSVAGTGGTDEYQYDENGNVITKLHDGSVVRTILYDGANRVSRISDGGSFAYDASGQRIKKSEDGVTTYYFFDAYEEEHEGTDVTIIKYYFVNSQRIAKVSQLNAETPVISYFHTDHLGSSVMMTDESGARTMSSTYTPSGSDAYIAGTSDIKYKFTGQEEDSGCGLYYYGARYYDPELGRFLQADTYLDGLNRYAYCGNNPIRYIDPTGNMLVEGSSTEEIGDVVIDESGNHVVTSNNEDNCYYFLLPGIIIEDSPFYPDGRPDDIPDHVSSSEPAVVTENVPAVPEIIKVDSFNGDFGADYRYSAYKNYFNLNIMQGIEDSFNCFLELTMDCGYALIGASLVGLVVDIAIPALLANAGNSVNNVNVFGSVVDKWKRVPETLQEQMALDAAKKGAGRMIIENLSDPMFKGMEKWQYVVKSKNGINTVIHYVCDVVTGALMDFKFK